MLLRRAPTSRCPSATGMPTSRAHTASRSSTPCWRSATTAIWPRRSSTPTSPSHAYDPFTCCLMLVVGLRLDLHLLLCTVCRPSRIRITANATWGGRGHSCCCRLCQQCQQLWLLVSFFNFHVPEPVSMCGHESACVRAVRSIFDNAQCGCACRASSRGPWAARLGHSPLALSSTRLLMSRLALAS